MKKFLLTAILVFGLASVTASASLVGELGILDTSGTNPLTGQPWKAGDTYRLVFVSSETTPATSTDIFYYNSFVQSVADGASLGSVNWYIVGSTAAVDARDNTGTNPWAPTDVSVPIYLTDGTTKIADNNYDLWNGNIDAPINIDENGIAVADNTDVWTGTYADGTSMISHSPDRVLGGSSEEPPKTTTGNVSKTTGLWIRIYNWPPTQYKPVYAISEPLTVQENYPSVEAGHSWITWSNEPVILDPVVINNDTQVPQRNLIYLWTAEPSAGVSITEDGIEPDDTTTPHAVVTVTKPADTVDVYVVTLKLSVTLEGVVTLDDTVTIDVYDDPCKAAESKGMEATYSEADFNMNCAVDIDDLAAIASAWLYDYSLVGP